MATPDQYVQTAASWFQYRLLQGDDPVSLMSFAVSHFPGFSQATLDEAYQLALQGIQTAANAVDLGPDESLTAASTGQAQPGGLADVRLLLTFIDDKGNLKYRYIDLEVPWDTTKAQLYTDIAFESADVATDYGWSLEDITIVPGLFVPRS